MGRDGNNATKRPGECPAHSIHIVHVCTCVRSCCMTASLPSCTRSRASLRTKQMRAATRRTAAATSCCCSGVNHGTHKDPARQGQRKCHVTERTAQLEDGGVEPVIMRSFLNKEVVSVCTATPK